MRRIRAPEHADRLHCVFEVAEKVTEIDVEQIAVRLDHDV